MASHDGPSWQAVMTGRHDRPLCQAVMTGRHDGSSWQVVMTGRHDGSSWQAIMTGRHDGSSWQAIMSGLHDRPSWRVVMSGRHVTPSCQAVMTGHHDRPSWRVVMSGRHVTPSCQAVMTGRHEGPSCWLSFLTAQRHDALTWRNIRVVFDSDPFAPLCEKMTSFTKPEVHKVLHCHNRRTEPRSKVTCIENLVKCGRVVSRYARVQHCWNRDASQNNSTLETDPKMSYRAIAQRQHFVS